VDSGCVGGVSVCDDSELLIWGCGADGLGHGDVAAIRLCYRRGGKRYVEDLVEMKKKTK